MDRRQRKTREAIFSAFIDLLSEKDLNQITVGEIIEQADVGRATFYAHFETKDYLLKELCEDLFCHIIDASGNCIHEHKHLFQCEAPESVFLHLFQHLLRNDNHILQLLSCRNNDVFLQFFKIQLENLVKEQLHLFHQRKHPQLPESLWIDHISSTFVETVRWWIDHGMKESPEIICSYFHWAV